MVTTGQLKTISGPYQNTKRTAITSVQTLIDLAQKEVPETYVHDSIAYDGNYKFWHISFKSNDPLEIPYIQCCKKD